jgi:hypothetical protein
MPLVEYKLGILALSPSPSADGGGAINANFRVLADLTEQLQDELETNVALLNATENVLAGSLVVSKSVRSGIVALTDQPTITTDASMGNTFTATLAGNRTIAAPTNPESGQILRYRFKQDEVGNRTVTWNSVFRFSGGIAPVLTVAAGKVDYIAFEYNLEDAKWDCIGTRMNF